MSQIDTSIFKSYDIRGIYGESLDKDLTYKIGRAYAELIKSEMPDQDLDIVVGGDMRTSTPELRKAVTEGLTDGGVNVVDIGLSSTPTFYFAVSYYGYDGGIQVSASHNPPEYNGFKMVRGRGKPISGDTGIMDIRDMVVENNFPEVETKGTVTSRESVLDDLITVQLGGIDTEEIKPFKIVVDTSNAMAILDIEALFEKLPCEVVYMNKELDGTFPNHLPDPLEEENLEQVKERILAENADLAIATDGDGDRYFFLDEKGEVVFQPAVRGLIAQLYLERNPGTTVCYDIRPGKVTEDLIEEAIEEYTGDMIVTKVGHSLIKEVMLMHDASFAGESSGHYFFRYPFGTYDAPLQLTLDFLELLSKDGRPVSWINDMYRDKYHHSGEINSEVEDKEGMMKKLAEKYSDADNINWLDGVTIEYDDFWFNVRPSNTEPKLRLNLEAVSKEIMEEKRDEVLGIIRA